MIPLRDTGPDDFAALRTLLRSAGYTTPGVLERTGTRSLPDAREGRVARSALPLTDARDALIRLFLDEWALPAADATRLLAEDSLALLEHIGLIRRNGTAIVPTVMLYPVEDVFLASDLARDPERPTADIDLPSDVVYPAISANTGDFLSLMPRSPVERFLELCGGTGVAAIVSAPRCGAAVTADITERSTRFAEWNAKLNGFTNVRAVCGDLYEPVEGETFDRIVAHPPYMPALEQQLIYRDGGEDGEQVTRRVIAGLPRHLAPGGTFHATCFMTDRRNEPLEQRVRAMLGAEHADFDVLLVVTAVSPVAEYYFRIALEGEIPIERGERIAAHLQERNVESITLCTIRIRRHEGPAEPITLRKQRGASTTAEDLDRALPNGQLRHSTADDDVRPQLSPHARMTVTHVPASGDWIAEGCHITIESPFRQQLDAAPDLAQFLGLCDGRIPVPELFRVLRDRGILPEAMTAHDFRGLVSGLIRDGFLVDAGRGRQAARVGGPGAANQPVRS